MSSISKNLGNIFITDISSPTTAGNINVTNISSGNILSTNIIGTNISSTNFFTSNISSSTLNLSTSLNAFGNSNTLGNLFTTGGNLGIGVVNPSAQLQLSNLLSNKKIVLYDGSNNLHQFYGLGVNGSVFRYQIDTIGSNHIFYAAVNSTTSNELFRIQGTGNVIVAGTMNSVSISSGNIFTSNISAGTLNVSSQTIGNMISSNINTTNITSSNIISTNIISTNIFGTNNTLTNLTLVSGSFGSLSTGNISISGNMTVGGNLLVQGSLISVNVTSVNVINSNITASSLNASNITSTNIVATNISSSTLNLSTITTSSLLATSLISSSNILSSNITSTNIVGTNISSSTLNLSTITTSSLLATSLISSSNILSSNITSTNIVGTNISSSTLNLSTITTSSLLATSNIDIRGVLNVFTTTKTLFGGIVSELNSIINFGINDTRFGAVSTLGTQGGFYRVDTRQGLNPIQIIVNDTSGNLSFPLQISLTGNTLINYKNNQRTLQIGNTINTSSQGNISIIGTGQARYHLFNGGGVTEWVFGQKTNTNHSFILSTLIGVTENDIFIVTTQGNIGINNSAPSYNLDVNGTARITNNLITSLIGINTTSPSTTTGMALDIRKSNLNCTLGTTLFSQLNLSGDYGAGGTYQGFVGGFIQGGTNYNQNTYLALGVQGNNNILNTELIRLTDTNSGSVGIGTSSPSFKLDINGSFRHQSNNNGPPNNFYIVNSNSGGSAYSIIQMGNNTNNSLSIFLNSSTRTIDGGVNTATIRNDSGTLRLQSNVGGSTGIYLSGSNVGINTSNPSYMLDVQQNNIAQINLQNTGTGSSQMLFLSNNDSKNYIQASGDLLFAAIGSSIQRSLSLTTGGNVNIGTSNIFSPGSKLTIIGGNQASGGTQSNLAFSFSGAPGYYHYITSRHNAVVNSTQNAIDFFVNNSATQAGSSAPNSGNVNALSITATGVGIFNSNPNYTLDVNGTIRISSGNLRINPTDGVTSLLLDFKNTAGYGIFASNLSNVSARGTSFDFQSTDFNNGSITTRNLLSLRPEGNVGINTSNPNFTLDVSGTARITNSLTTGSLLATNGISVNYGSGLNINNAINTKILDVSFQNSQDQVNIYTPGNNNGLSKLCLQHNGNVGINTTAPIYTLDVNGSIDAGTFLTSGNVYSTNITSSNIVGTSISSGSLNANEIKNIYTYGTDQDTSFTSGWYNIGSVGTSSNSGRFKLSILGGNQYGINIAPYEVVIMGSINNNNNNQTQSNCSGTWSIVSGSNSNITNVKFVQFTQNTLSSSRYLYSIYVFFSTTFSLHSVFSYLRSPLIFTQQFTTTTDPGVNSVYVEAALNYLIVNSVNFSGNVGINTTAPSNTLDVNGTTRIFNSTNNVSMALSSSNGPFGSIEAFTSGNTSVKIPLCLNAYGGNIGIRTTAPGDILQVANVMLMASSGNLTVTGDVLAFGTISDQRLKTNVENINNGIETINNLRPVTFNWKDDIFNQQKRGTSDSGFIAQEVEPVIPHAVGEYNEIESGEIYKNMRHERIIPYLVKAIQELNLKVNILSNQIIALQK